MLTIAFASFDGPLAKSLDKPISKCSLTGGIADWPPYQTFNGNQVSGLQVELVKNIAKQAGCSVKFNKMLYFQAQEAVEKGDIDFTLNATITDSRKQFGHFSIPYRNEILVLYVRKAFHEQCNANSLEMLIENGSVLGLEKKMVYGPELTKIQNSPQLNKRIKYFNHTGQTAQFLIDNKVDGIVDDPVMIAYRT